MPREQSAGLNTNSRVYQIVMSNDSTIAAYLAEHPKMTGALFTMMLLLSQAGNVVGASGMTTRGP